MLRSANLIGEDMVVSVRIGGLATGPTGPTFSGTTTSVMATAVGVNFHSKMETTNTKGAGDKRVRNRFHSVSDEMTIRKLVSSAGYLFGDTAGSLIGHYIEITTIPLSTLSSPLVSVGVITDWEWDSEQTKAQAENVKIDLNPDFDIAS